MAMTRVVGPAKSLARALSRGRLLLTLEKDVLLTKVSVDSGGQVALETESWDEYWITLRGLGRTHLDELLGRLHSAWLKYIRNPFAMDLRRDYCLAYFRLLIQVLTHQNAETSEPWAHALQAVLGFECFTVSSGDLGRRAVAAGTSTTRNPCYLLSKLKMPNALDDPQLLPLITVPDHHSPELFYHYRQYGLSLDSPISLLLYPACSQANRSDSFRVINWLTGGISDFVDPRARERSLRISESILGPILLFHTPADPATICVEIIDVGAGSGILSASLCRHLVSLGETAGFEPKFRIWFVDLEPSDPARFFREGKLRGLVDSLNFVGDDYRRWLRKHPIPSGTDGIRFAILSKLLNNVSKFSIRPLTDRETRLVLVRARLSSNSTDCRPNICLARENDGVETLAVSSSRIELQDGRSFVQPSLSDFYRGLSRIGTNAKGRTLGHEGSLYAPIRRFDPDSLVTLDGASVISRLLQHCGYLIIEDSDVRPIDLSDHIQRFSLKSVAALDMTKSLGLRGNHAYVLWNSDTPGSAPPLSGERIE